MPPKASTSVPSKAPVGGKRLKHPPKPPKPVEEQIKGHFHSLHAQIDGGHFKNAIKTCNKILVLAPEDQDALDAKLFLLIQTEQYAAALDLINASSNDAHAFEKAYVLYRLHKEEDAFEVVKGAREAGSVDDRALTHLEAQIKYRQTDYDTARDIYNGLLDTCAEDTEEHPDLVTNLNATQAHLDFLSSGYLSALNSLEISVAALEEAGAPLLSSGVTGAASLAGKQTPAAPTSAEPAAPKPARKSRIPKHVVPGVTPMPDPERWLKKKERTRVEGRGGKRRRKEGMGTGATQGASVPAERERVGAPSGGSGAGTGTGGGFGRPKKNKKGR